jgi:hypothetical protein
MTNKMPSEEERLRQIEIEIDKHSKHLYQKINKFLSLDKPSDVIILKSHLICEYYINQILIFRNIHTIHEIDDKKFYQKINSAFDTNIPEEKNILEKLKALNKLRNKVGHELEYLLSESDVDMIGYLGGKDYIIKKYDYTSIDVLLRHILIMTVCDVSMFLFKIISAEKNKEYIKSIVSEGV